MPGGSPLYGTLTGGRNSAWHEMNTFEYLSFRLLGSGEVQQSRRSFHVRMEFVLHFHPTRQDRTMIRQIAGTKAAPDPWSTRNLLCESPRCYLKDATNNLNIKIKWRQHAHGAAAAQCLFRLPPPSAPVTPELETPNQCTIDVELQNVLRITALSR